MSKFETMSKQQTQEIDELLNAADAIIGSRTPVIKGNPHMAETIGTAVGGATGAAIAASAGTVGVTSSLAAGGLGTAAAIGGGVLGITLLPVVVTALLLGGIGMLIGNDIEKKKEIEMQSEYVKEITKKQQQVYEKYNNLKQEYERTSKDKDEIIKQQQEKLAEYEVMYEALKKKRTYLESNLSLA